MMMIAQGYNTITNTPIIMH